MASSARRPEPRTVVPRGGVTVGRPGGGRRPLPAGFLWPSRAGAPGGFSGERTWRTSAAHDESGGRGVAMQTVGSLAGRVAIVTGGARGIGAAVAAAFV